MKTIAGIILSCAILVSITGHLTIPCIYASVELPDKKTAPSSDVLKKELDEDKRQEALEIYKLGMEYSNLGQIDKAIEEYKHALEIDPNLAEAHLNLGWSYTLKRQDYAIAMQETLEAIRLKPNLLIGYRNLWWIYRLQKMYDKALETLKRIIALEPDNAVNYINLGDAYVSDNLNLDLAVESFKKGLTLDPNNVYLHSKLGKTYEFQKKYDMAITEFKKGIALEPLDTYNYLFMAVALGKSGKKGEIPPLMKKGYETAAKTIIDKERWDLKLLQYLGGEFSEEELFKKATLNPIHKCQALYYAGLKHIWEGRKTRGIELLTEAQAMKIDALSEYELLKTELHVLQQKK